jgi:hypothetical protein
MLVDERLDALTPRERLALLRYGWRPAPWENPPDFAARILKRDPKITLANSRRLVAIFRAAYDAMVAK